MAEPAPPQKAVTPNAAGSEAPRSGAGRAFSLAGKTLGILIALALLVAVTDPKWVTERILVPIFGKGILVPPPPAVPPNPALERLYQSVTEKALRDHVRHLSSLGSRIPGYPGADRAADYIVKEIVGTPDTPPIQCLVTELDRQGQPIQRTYPIRQVAPQEAWAPGEARPFLTVETFEVPVPIDEGARLTLPGEGPLEGRTVPLHCLWPNHVQTPCLPREGITGTLVDCGRGDLREVHESLSGAIALVHFACDKRYITLRMLGAKAIIFHAGDEDRGDTGGLVTLSQALDKMLVVPADIPRYYVDAAGLKVLRRLLQMDRPAERRTVSRDARQVRLQARMQWKTVTARNISVELPGSLEDLPTREGGTRVPWRSERIVVGAYYDSISVVPAVAPGAENALSAAALLELIKALANWKDRRFTVTCVFTGAHFQGMAGIYEWLNRHARKNAIFVRQMEERGDRPVPFKVFVGLDLSSRGFQVASFSEGAFTNPNLTTDNYRKNALAPYAKTLEDYHDEIWRQLKADTPESRYANARYFNAITPAKRSWKHFMRGVDLGFEHEAAHRVGGAAFTLATPNDPRSLVDTPLDTFERVSPYLGNVTTQARTVTGLVLKATSDHKFFPESKLELPDDAGAIDGQIVWFDRDVNFFVPKAPVSNALVTYQMNGWTEASCGGVRTLIAAITTSGRPQRHVARQRGMIGDGSPSHDASTNVEAAGRFAFPVRRVRGDTEIEAFAFDDAGRITFAPDRGQEGDKNYPMKVTNSSAVEHTTEVLFRCRAISIFEIVDSRRLSALDSMNVLTSNDSDPQWYGTKFVPNQSTKEGRTTPAAVVFVEPDKSIKLFMSTGLYGIKYLLTNADPNLLDHPPTAGEVGRATEYYEALSRGTGYNPEESVIFDPFFKAAKDMWIVDDIRVKNMARYGIRNERLDRLHEEARLALSKARHALSQDPPNYPVYVEESRRAWGLEARGYPDVKATATDSVNGIVFYFMLLLPFSFFCERLLFGFKDIRARMAGVAGVFAAVFLVLHLVHPAFKLTTSPYIILLAFVVLVLGLIVLIVLMRKFSEEVQKSKRASSGIHEVDVGRLSATAAAINLGINNLRKRKVRTTLTAVTLILLTFTVLSFTSIQTSLKPFILPHGKAPLYDGALIRERAWQGLQDVKLEYVRSTFSGTGAGAELPGEQPSGPGLSAEEQTYRRWRATVVPRTWIQAKVKGDTEFILVRNEANNCTANAFGLMGFAPEERLVLKEGHKGQGFEKLGLGTRDQPVWFDENDRYACFISTHMASDKLLDIKPADIGKVQVEMYGHLFLVKGLFDGDKFNEIKDLDGEPLTPVDFVKEAGEVTQAAKEDPSQQAAQPIRQFEHIDAKNCVIIPYRTAQDLGGILSSIALVDFKYGEGETPPQGETWHAAITHFMDRVALTVFVADVPKSAVDVWSSISRTGVGRVANLLIPIVIAAFIVLNTMIGAVYERAREIGIYSAIGLTPRHIAALFLAESAVFATVGAVVGYLIGQTLVRILSAVGGLEGSGLVLNYSSLSAIWSTVIVMITTFLSTLYPARKAAEMSVPDVTRRWHFPEPQGDEWVFDFPFTLSGTEVPGIYTYMARVFESYGEGSVGGFMTEEVRLTAAAHELGPKYTITMKTWLAPYDLGISQSVRMDAIHTGEANIYRIEVRLHRESGDVASWRRINRGFLNVLRKRFLVWRTMAPGFREEYLEQGRQLTQLALA